MFTGIVEELGTVRSIDQRAHVIRIDVAAVDVVIDSSVGDSVAVNGVCLTVVDVNEHGFRFDVIPESIERSSLGALVEGSRVNLERPLRLDARLDGHIVQGHVDAVANVTSAERDQIGGYRLRVEVPDELSTYIVEKGSITIDGVSLTVASMSADSFDVALIPHTLEITTLGERRAGDVVNLEVDVIAKYVARNINAYLPSLGAS